MAAYVDTVEGARTQPVNVQSEIAKWLKAQNLQKLIPLFAEEDMTLDELIEFADDEVNFKQYLKELNVPKASVFRILSKIKKTKQSNQPPAANTHDAANHPNVVVVITQKEQDAMDSLNKRNETINALIQRLAQQDEKVSQNEQAVQSTMKEEYNELIRLIQQSHEEASNTLSEIAKQKKSEISAKLQQLETQQNNTKNAIKSCNGFVHNVNMDRTQRQKKILSTVDGVMEQDIPQNMAHVPTDIVLEFRKESISPFVSNLVAVYAAHPIPVIDEIKCESITSEACTVRWKAALRAPYLNKKRKSKFYIQIQNANEEMDEKEREPLDSEMILFDTNNKHYEYKMTDLKRDRLYKMKIVLFEGKENDSETITQRTDSESLLFNFKTLAHDSDEQAFVYEFDYDTNGILYFLGTNYGKEQWENPAERGLVTLKSLSGWSAGSINYIVSRTYTQSFSYSGTDNWITIDFGDKLKIKANRYTLQYCNKEGSCPWYLRDWNFEGSNDGSNWSIIKQHENDKTFTKNNKLESHTWTLPDCTQYYQHFRIKMTGSNADQSNWTFAYGMLEIYGYLTGHK